MRMSISDWAPEEIKNILKYVDGKLYLFCSAEGCGSSRQTAGKKSVLSRYHSLQWKEALLFCAEHGGRYAKPSKLQIESWPKNHKQCRSCLEVKSFDSFHKHKEALFGYNTECKDCRRPKSKKQYNNTTHEYRMWNAAKHRARLKDITFTLNVSDIVIPSVCPILGIPITLIDPNSDGSPSLDRLDPNLGYTVENTRVVSRRGNTLKNNMTLEEAHLVYLDLSNLQLNNN